MFPRRIRGHCKHGKTYESTARKKYVHYVKFRLKHDIDLREIEIAIQPNLSWLAANPDGFIGDKTEADIDLMEIKCPNTKKNSSHEEIVNDAKFYVSLLNGRPLPKRNHPNCYY